MNQRQQAQPAPHAAPAGGTGAQNMIAPNAIPANLMGLMANPALASAVAGSAHLFPPAAMLSNPGAFLSMPEAFVNAAAAAAAAAAGQQQSTAAPGGVVLPRLAAAGMGDQAQQHQTQQAQQQPATQQSISPAPGPPTSVLPSLPPLPSTGQIQQELQQHQAQMIPTAAATEDDKRAARRTDLTPEERAKQNRDRNREHARSTRLRKKAYVQKLKELVEGLHAERTEEVRQRRVAIQHLAEMQNVRRGVVRSFLRFHSQFESDPRKWETLLEDDFWLKQPVTPYRSFPRTEIEQDCRMTRGVKGMVADSASVAVMVEGIGSRSTRWMQIKREEFFLFEESKRGPDRMPHTISRQDSRMQAGVSSLSSSSGSSNGSATDEANKNQKRDTSATMPDGKAKVSSSSSGSNDSRQKQLAAASKDFHDYHAQPLPDPKLGDSGSSSPSEDSPEDSNGSTNGDAGKRLCTDSSSGDDSGAAIAAPATKRQKTENGNGSGLPPNIAKTGGITANAMGVGGANARLQQVAPAIPLPPFAGLGKRPASTGAAQPGAVNNVNLVRSGVDNPLNPSNSLGRSAMVPADMDASSSNSSQLPQIRACYHVNEDDMILMEDVLMCPFVMRSQDAVVCGALAECVMPGMFRAHFSSRNKLLSVEMVYDAMGFMQQLERASGSERTAQIIPGSLEMALTPSATEARVITLAEPPFLIVNVNEMWTRLTKYTQMEVEGRELKALLEGNRTLPEAGNRTGKPIHNFEDVAKGICASSTNIHYRKNGEEFVDYVCTYPLTNSNDEITHLLHTSKELPALPASIE